MPPPLLLPVLALLLFEALSRNWIGEIGEKMVSVLKRYPVITTEKLQTLENLEQESWRSEKQNSQPDGVKRLYWNK